MNYKRNIILVTCLIFLLPVPVSADLCDDIMKKAHRIFDAAKAASKQGEFANAVKFYEEAEGYYNKVSVIRNCRCSKIVGSAKKSISICRKNAANSRIALANQENYEAEVKIVEIYNLGARKYNQGNSYARNQQWELAINAFEEASEIWKSIASSETEKGREAMQWAEQARSLANLARQRLEY